MVKTWAAMIGQVANWHLAASVLVQVRVLDIRTRYDKVDLRIEPVAGSGSKWVQMDSVTFETFET